MKETLDSAGRANDLRWLNRWVAGQVKFKWFGWVRANDPGAAFEKDNSKPWSPYHQKQRSLRYFTITADGGNR